MLAVLDPSLFTDDSVDLDDVEEVVRNRLRIYAELTAPVVDYYAGKGVLSRILGQGTAEEVSQRIMSVLHMHTES